jgi:hypothetical protein
MLSDENVWFDCEKLAVRNEKPSIQSRPDLNKKREQLWRQIRISVCDIKSD